MREFREFNFERTADISEVDDFCVDNYLKDKPKNVDFVVYEETVKELHKIDVALDGVKQCQETSPLMQLVKISYDDFVNQANIYLISRITHSFERKSAISEKEYLANKAEVKMHKDHQNMYHSFGSMIGIAKSEGQNGDKFITNITKILHGLKLSNKIKYDNSDEGKQKYFEIISTLTNIESNILDFPNRNPDSSDKDMTDFLNDIQSMKDGLNKYNLNELDMSTFKYAITSLGVRSAYLYKHPDIIK